MSRINRTAAELDAIRKYYVEDGMSATDIARLRGLGETRNMIIGIVNRKGWQRTTATTRQTKRDRGVAERAQQRQEAEAKAKAARESKALAPAPVRAVVAPTAPRIDDGTGPTLLELTSQQCRNPVGPDTRETGRDQMFCGARVQTRMIEVSKGQFVDKVDSYCAPCAAKLRVGIKRANSAPEFMRSMRRFA